MSTDLTFSDFILKQATNAGIFLGQRENPLTGEKSVNLKAAKGCLDVIILMKAKTSGNLTAPEQSLLNDTLKTIEQLYNETEAL